MPRYTDLNDTSVDGVASSSFQGEFLGLTERMPMASAELEGRLMLYVGTSGAYEQYAFYICQKNSDGTWQWNRQNLKPPYTLTPLCTVESDASGNLVSSEITTAELGALQGVRSNIQGQIDTKEPTVMGAAMTVTKAKLPVRRVLISDANGNIAYSAITTTELTALRGLESSIQGQLDAKVDTATTVNGHPLTGDITLSAWDVKAMPSSTSIPSKTSDLVNDSRYVTEDTELLENYYPKEETYTRAEINNLITLIPEMEYRAVESLPATGDAGYVYIVPTENGYEQYIWSDGVWVYLGSTTPKPDISQDAGGVKVNGTPIQNATSKQAGLMSAEQADWLQNGTVTGGTGSVAEGMLNIQLFTHGDIVDIDPIVLPSRSYGSLQLVRDSSHNCFKEYAQYDYLEDVTLENNWVITRPFDVEVMSAGRFGETNTMFSTIHIPSGAFYVSDSDLVFSNAESNTRVGVRVVFTKDGEIKVYDCNGIETPASTTPGYMEVGQSQYRTVVTVLRPI